MRIRLLRGRFFVPILIKLRKLINQNLRRKKLVPDPNIIAEILPTLQLRIH